MAALGGITFGQLGKVARRPALGRAVFGAGAEGGDGAFGVEPVFGEGGLAAGFVDGKAGEIGARLEGLVFRVGQRGIAVYHQRQGGFVELADVVEQRIAALTHVAGAQGNAAGAGDERGFEGAGQHDDLVVAALPERFAQLPAAAQLQGAVGKRVFQDLADFGHPLKYGHRPFGREHINPAAGMELVQAAVERLRHHAVADPGGGDDEDGLGHAGFG